MKIKNIIFGVLIGIFSFINVEAANLSFDGSKTIKSTEAGTIDIKLNTESEEISKVEFTLEYDSSLISINGNVSESFGKTISKSNNQYYIYTDGRAMEDKAVIVSLTITNKATSDNTASIKITNIKINGEAIDDTKGDTKELELTTTTQAPKHTSAKLSNINVKGYNLTPKFDKNTSEYKINIADSVRTFSLITTCEETGCITETTCGTPECTVSGTKVTPADGKNILNILVTSEDNSTTQKYVLTIYKGKTTDDSEFLSNIEVEKLKLNEEFKKDVLDYTLTVDNTVDSLKITATPEDEKATVKIKGNDKLQMGENVVTITVTSSETKKTKIYNITVTKEEETTTTTTTKKTTVAPVVSKKSNNNKMIIIIVIGVVGLTIIGVSGYFIFRKKPTKKVEKKSQEIEPENEEEMPILKQNQNESFETDEDNTVDVDTALIDLMNTKELELTKEFKKTE